MSSAYLPYTLSRDIDQILDALVAGKLTSLEARNQIVSLLAGGTVVVEA